MDKFDCYVLRFVMDAEAKLNAQDGSSSSSSGGSGSGEGSNKDEHGVKG
jgi:hypothetical protein